MGILDGLFGNSQFDPQTSSGGAGPGWLGMLLGASGNAGYGQPVQAAGFPPQPVANSAAPAFMPTAAAASSAGQQFAVAPPPLGLPGGALGNMVAMPAPRTRNSDDDLAIAGMNGGMPSYNPESNPLANAPIPPPPPPRTVWDGPEATLPIPDRGTFQLLPSDRFGSSTLAPAPRPAATIPARPIAAPPANIAATRQPGQSGVTRAQAGAGGLGRAADQSNSLTALLGGIGNGISGGFQGLFGPGGASQSPGLFDRLIAGATNLTTGGNPLAGILNAVNGLTTGQRTDRAGVALAQHSFPTRPICKSTGTAS